MFTVTGTGLTGGSATVSGWAMFIITDALTTACGTSRPFISVERLDPSDRFVLGHF
jgi:hypothetical protein